MARQQAQPGQLERRAGTDGEADAVPAVEGDALRALGPPAGVDRPGAQPPGARPGLEARAAGQQADRQQTEQAAQGAASVTKVSRPKRSGMWKLNVGDQPLNSGAVSAGRSMR